MAEDATIPPSLQPTLSVPIHTCTPFHIMLMQGLQGDRPLRSSVYYSHQNNLGLGCYRYWLVQYCPLVMSVAIRGNLSTARILYVPVASCFPFSFKCFLKSPHVYLNNDRQNNI